MKKIKKILFTAATPMNYIMFKPISDRLLTDERFEVVYTANHSPRKLYGALGVKNVKMIRHEIAEWKKFDMCICPGYFYKPRKTAVKVQIFHSASIDNYSVSPKA